MKRRGKVVDLQLVREREHSKWTREVCRQLEAVKKKAREGGANGVAIILSYPNGRVGTSESWEGDAWPQMCAGAAMLTRSLTDQT